jgi:uncharacterized protein (DUF305 family)
MPRSFARPAASVLRSGGAAALLLLLSACAGGGAPAASPAPVASPPGEPGELPPLLGAVATSFERPGHVPADVAFMHGMIPHHAQALRMAALVPDRTSNRQLHIMAERMAVAQGDEIQLMLRLARGRGRARPPSDGGDDHGHHGHGAHEVLMPGMLTEEDFEALAAARGDAFDRLFLELMIRHHEGAVIMVNELFASPGAAQEDFVYKLASDVYADQTTEIHFMRLMLDRIPERP